MNPDPKKKAEQKQGLLRTTNGPVGEGRGECSGLPATLWSNLSVETTHHSRGSYSTGQSHGSAVSSPSNGPESVVRGLTRRFSEMSKVSPSERIGVNCQRCQEEDAAFRVFTDAMDIDVCPSCAEEARQLKIAIEDLPRPDPGKEPAQKQIL